MILAALPREQYTYLRKYLAFVPLRSGDVLWEPNQPIESIYFPNSGIVCLVAVMRNGAMVGVAMTGREGFVGTPGSPRRSRYFGWCHRANRWGWSQDPV